MDRARLVDMLTVEGISTDSYTIDRDLDETHCLLSTAGGKWSVYYSERGHRRDQVIHAEEVDANNDLFNRLLNDDTTRRSFRYRHRWPS